ncbi:unnamed protein product, partial [Rotaria magnacalcarata]
MLLASFATRVKIQTLCNNIPNGNDNYNNEQPHL